MRNLQIMCVVLLASIASADTVTPRAGLVIEHSCKLTPGSYEMEGTITIKGSDIDVDCDGVELVGTKDRTHPDQFKGTAIQIDGGKNITIRNLHAHGYKFAILARGVTDLQITNCNFSYNYRQRLKSTPEKESEEDWLSHHQNEKDEWMRYGAAMYFTDCPKLHVDHCIAQNGQNALMMTRCNDATISENDFSFNSGLGIGLYRSSRNRVSRNRLDWCIRGYSDGVYNRGQDSAAILIYEQSNENTFAYNSATHSGDGFFLWAGQTTMDTGKGGCNDNFVCGNDFSYASNNGIEATFSRNAFVSNVCDSCDHGIWAGFSYDSSFRANRIHDCAADAIAIEHGQGNSILQNDIAGDSVAIRLWANPVDPNFAYAKQRDTRSRDYFIAGNEIVSKRATLIDLADSTDVRISPASLRERTKTNADTNGLLFEDVDTRDPRVVDNGPHMLVEGKLPAPVPGIPRGRRYMIIDEWGPYDFRYPRIFARGKDEKGNLKFEILGPSGSWKLIHRQNITAISAESGRMIPCQLVITADGAPEFELEFTGAEVTTPFGEKTPADTPVRFRYPR